MLTPVCLRIRCTLLGIAFVAASSCGGSGGDPTVDAPPSYAYLIPADRGDGWGTVALGDVGISEPLIVNATQSIVDGSYTGIDSMLIIRRGMLAHEYYSTGSWSSRHDLRSATKSITSLLIGIAIDQSFIVNEIEPVLAYIDGYPTIQNWDDRKNSLSIANFLTMSSGLNCDDGDGGSPGNERNMYPKSDWVKFALDLPMLRDPGIEFAYCTAGVVVLGEVIRESTGVAADEFAETHLFQPLGITNYNWEYSPSGQVDTGGHIHMTSRDMAKIGQLVLDQGVRDATQVVSSSWVTTSTDFHLQANEQNGYGYLWWRRSIGQTGTSLAIIASGNGGQLIFVIPSEELVVVFTGSNYNLALGDQQPLEIMDRYILPAIGE
jgi:CubicO group peptidase (beta-lactamase class C family)